MIPKGWHTSSATSIDHESGKWRISKANDKFYTLWAKVGAHWNMAREAPFTSASEAAGYSMRLENTK